MPTQFLGALLHTMAISGLPRVRTELDPLLIIPSLAHHPVQRNSQPPRHGDLGDLSSPPHHQVKVSAAPFRKTAHRYERRDRRFVAVRTGCRAIESSFGLHTLQRKRVEARFGAVLYGKTFPEITVLSAPRKSVGNERLGTISSKSLWVGSSLSSCCITPDREAQPPTPRKSCSGKYAKSERHRTQ